MHEHHMLTFGRYFLIGSLAKNDAEIIRLAGLLRGTESAAQAVSYGLASVSIMGQVGSVYLNFSLWAVSLIPAWFVVKEIGVSIGLRHESDKTLEQRHGKDATLEQ